MPKVGARKNREIELAQRAMVNEDAAVEFWERHRWGNSFKEATDRAQALGLTAPDIAVHMGVKPQTYRVMRVPGEHGRRPPAEWRAMLGRAIDQRMGELGDLRKQVERGE